MPVTSQNPLLTSYLASRCRWRWPPSVCVWGLAELCLNLSFLCVVSQSCACGILAPVIFPNFLLISNLNFPKHRKLDFSKTPNALQCAVVWSLHGHNQFHREDHLVPDKVGDENGHLSQRSALSAAECGEPAQSRGSLPTCAAAPCRSSSRTHIVSM